MDLRNTWDQWPDEHGRFGEFGGRYVAETLMPLILELEDAYRAAKKDPAFAAQMDDLWAHYVGRPSPLYFAERLTEAVGDATMQLAFEQHWVDDGAEVAHHGVPRHLNVAGILVDLDLCNMTAAGVVVSAGDVVRISFEAKPFTIGHTGAAEGGLGNGDKIIAAIRTSDDELAALKLNIARTGFKHLCRDPFPFFDNLFRTVHNTGARYRGGARPACS